MTTSTFTACGVTVTPNPESGTITMTDTLGCTITVPAGYASDLAHDICEAMREGCTDGVLEDGPHSIAYDGALGGADPRWVQGGLPDAFAAVTTLYLGIFAAVAGIKSVPIQQALEVLGVTGYIASGGPHYENDGYALFVSSMDVARLLGVDEASLLRLAELGLLGNHGRRDGSVLAVDVLRALGHAVPQRIHP
ncbi:hypothetical protein [Tsukamurella spumae]|uniref:Uncharacterized protein n=1 Tax=Tsukamurella spumae TaxID=44753 RepID=A0A846X6B1_9ACTN|nr:hypothetical protein [Tsukamurella spumae]NKY19742.1 hypothetical protein [Tsukamurella spumae]